MKTLSIEAIKVRLRRHVSCVLALITFKGILWALIIVVVLLTAGRFVMRWQKLEKIKLDDIFNVLALVFLLAS